MVAKKRPQEYAPVWEIYSIVRVLTAEEAEYLNKHQYAQYEKQDFHMGDLELRWNTGSFMVSKEYFEKHFVPIKRTVKENKR
jgi:hypothetical protein